MITVGDLMTRDLVTLAEDHDLALADNLLRLGRIRHLPVVREEALVGLVTHLDLVRALANRTRPAARSILARDIMVREVVTATPELSVGTAARRMLEHRIGCLPVVEGRGRLVGILTDADILRHTATIL